MGCPNCAANLAELGPGWWAAFFLIGIFSMLAGFLVYVVRRDGVTDTDHVEVKNDFLDCENDEIPPRSAEQGEEATP
ncbi:MAG: hypothetical protein ABI743_01060 [bacterium]